MTDHHIKSRSLSNDKKRHEENESPSLSVDSHQTQSLDRKISRKFFRHQLSRIGLTILILNVVAAIFAPWIAPHSPIEIHVDEILQPPNAKYPLGTDELGRDILSRTIFSARVSIQVMLISVGLAVVLGSAIGLYSGYVGGWIDDVIMRIVDALLSFPMLILALSIIAMLGPSFVNAMLAIAVVNIPRVARLVRGQVLSMKSWEFVDAARAIGCSRSRIIYRHIWPNISHVVIVYASLRASQAIITESSLSFLGLGIQPPTPSWGWMLAVGMSYWHQAWWMSVFPGLAIFIFVLALNFIGDALRDAMDVKL